jgi:Tol biopolymer transport system component
MADDIESKSRSLYMLDLKTGVITKLKALVAVSLSWSPDSERLALDIPYAGAPKVAIYEIGSGSLHELKKGSFPAWSPSGDWIAYVSASEQEIRLTRPDGADDHVLKNVRNHLFGYRSFGLQPVWSPDGGHLLINVYRGEGNTQDVLLLDFSTGRAETKSRDGDPIMGWASKPEGEK